MEMEYFELISIKMNSVNFNPVINGDPVSYVIFDDLLNKNGHLGDKGY